MWFSSVFFYLFCVILVCIFIPWRYKSGIKISDFHQNIARHFIKPKKYIFCFSYIRPSLKDKKKIITSYFHIKNHIVFTQNKKKYSKKVLACTLALITSLLEPWEFGQYFKNSKKYCLFLVFGIINLYIEHIPCRTSPVLRSASDFFFVCWIGSLRVAP